MKKISILLLLTLITTSVSAQMRPGRSIGKLKINWYKSGWFLEGNGGVRFLGQTSDIAKMQIRPSLNGGVGYFFNEKVGIKGRVDAHQFAATYADKTDLSMSVSGSAEVVLRLIQIFSPRTSRDFALNLHAGSGLSALINPSVRKQVEANGGEYKGKLFNADNVGHVIIGIMPQYHINSRVSINLDVSHFSQFKQNRTYDTHNGVETKAVTGVIGATVGLTFRP